MKKLNYSIKAYGYKQKGILGVDFSPNNVQPANNQQFGEGDVPGIMLSSSIIRPFGTYRGMALTSFCDGFVFSPEFARKEGDRAPVIPALRS